MKRMGLWLCVCLLAGCSASMPVTEQKDGVYQAEILIGQKRAAVLKAAETVFGQPKESGAIFKDSDYEVESRRYNFTNVSDFVMYFHKNIFIQAGLMPVESPEYPPLRPDYKGISQDKPGPVLGYTIFMDDQEVVLDTIQP